MVIVFLSIALLISISRWGGSSSAGAAAVAVASKEFLVLFSVLGMITFTAFVTWMMPRFEATQVVPRRVRDALDTLTEGLLVLDEHERIVVANRAFCENVQTRPDRLVGRAASRLRWICSDEATQADFPWARVLQSGSSSSRVTCREQILRYRLPDGQLRFLAVSAASIDSSENHHRGVLATFRDVTEVEQERADTEKMLAVLRANREEISHRNRILEELANRDALTACLNRRAFMGLFGEQFAQAASAGADLACLMFDNDHFKNVNDTYGHSTGDEVLRRVAATLRDSFTEIGHVCRYGGEEFCVLLPSTAIEGAVEHAEVARRAIEAIRFEQPKDLRLTASIGATDMTFDARGPEAMIDQADKCLYVAKSQGRNQVVPFSRDIDALKIEDLGGHSAAVMASAETNEIPFHAVMGLVSALAYRDAATAEHCRRVANLCVRGAASLLDQHSTYILEMAALLHDIGKISLPDEVLQKPGPLTPDQWRLIAKHHRIGIEIVSGTFHHDELCEIVRTHLAFYGGRSLIGDLPSGQDIPLAARLLTIADTYDVITTDRPHRPGRSHAAAVAELRRCAGRQFDPVLVEHFVAALAAHPQAVLGCEKVSRQTALQIGLQIEQLAEAIDSRNLSNLQLLASRLTAMAEHHRLDSIAAAATSLLDDAAAENLQWIRLLEDTQRLLDLCRSTQDAFVIDRKEA